MATLSGPTASLIAVQRLPGPAPRCARCACRSGPRRRSWNWPASTVGKISVPTPGCPTSHQASSRGDGQVAGQHEPAAAQTAPRSTAGVAVAQPVEREAPGGRAPRPWWRAAAARPTAPARTCWTGGRTSTIAKPTASDSGTNSARAAPSMKNDGRNTARMHSMASSRGTAVSALPSRTARAMESVCSICVWMFSTSTVASSTRMPTARARPPSVIRLIVCPVSHRATTAPSRAKRDVEHDDDDAAPVAQEQQHHQAGQDGAEQPLRCRRPTWPA